jgi:hypothetical protein
VIVLRGQGWAVETPRVPITRKELPERAQHSRWSKHPSVSEAAVAN